jgi:serine/threonine-protein phosphatase 4 catalytic subunit
MEAGGLSPAITTVDQLNDRERRQEIQHTGAIGDLLWNDPEDANGFAISPKCAGCIFGADVVSIFNYNNELDLIARSHELVMEGLKLMFHNQLVTVWIATNYRYRYRNLASIWEVDDAMTNSFRVFDPASQSERGGVPERTLPDYFI